MKIITCICEYNPFHLGHKYQIDTLREKFGQNSAVIAIMSGSFTQRGDTAVFDKYARAETAVACGCNLVLELPAPWSMAGAEFFARAGVSIAAAFNCADILAFGSESGDLEALKTTAINLSDKSFAEAVGRARRNNPGAQAGALRAEVYGLLFGESEHFTGSNDLLALEYLRTLYMLGCRLEPYAVKRVGGQYNSETPDVKDDSDAGFASATAIRGLIRSGGDFKSHMPEPSSAIAKRELSAGKYYCISNLDTAVTAFLRLHSNKMRGKMEVSGGIENRLHNAAMKFAVVNEIVTASLERRYSASRLRRAIIGSMLGFTMRDCEETPLFTNLLAADSVGRELLSRMRKCSQIPILAVPSAYKSLGSDARRQFERNLAAEALHALSAENPSVRCPNLFAPHEKIYTDK